MYRCVFCFPKTSVTSKDQLAPVLIKGSTEFSQCPKVVFLKLKPYTVKNYHFVKQKSSDFFQFEENRYQCSSLVKMKRCEADLDSKETQADVKSNLYQRWEMEAFVSALKICIFQLGRTGPTNNQ